MLRVTRSPDMNDYGVILSSLRYLTELKSDGSWKYENRFDKSVNEITTVDNDSASFSCFCVLVLARLAQCPTVGSSGHSCGPTILLVPPVLLLLCKLIAFAVKGLIKHGMGTNGKHPWRWAVRGTPD